MECNVINFKTAKLAKKKGFKEKVYAHYETPELEYSHSEKGDSENYVDLLYDYNSYKGNPPYDYIFYSAPTQSLLQKWLREVHDILIYVHPKSHHYFEYHIITNDDHIISSTRSNNWEEILELGLQEALELIILK